MVVIAAGLAMMTALGVNSSFALSATTLAIVGVGSGMFLSPNTAAMMGAVPPHRRGVAAGARMVLQNTGSVLSIAFVLAVVTAAVPKATLFRIFSGLGHGLDSAKLAPFIDNMHAALWAMVVASLIGALVSAMRPAHRPTS
jgi:MFS family permease